MDDRDRQGRIRVAVVGGGCAGMAAAHELTRPEQHGRFEVTVYQQGWRLGGKGASGRGPFGRIEEHGLHVWMGCYENAFRLMRSVYGELGRDPETCPISGWRDAFFPTSHIGLASRAEGGPGWAVWATMFPPLPGEPGSPLAADADNPFSVAGYLVRVTTVMRGLFDLAYGHTAPASDPGEALPLSDLLGAAGRLAKTTLGAVDAVMGLAEHQLLTLVRLVPSIASAPAISAVGELVSALLKALDVLRPTSRSDPHRQRAAEVLEITVAALGGIVRGGLLLDPRGFDRLDEIDFIDWLRENGASEYAANSPFLNGLYSLMFAYEGGDCTRPRQAAGQALRGCMRMFFTYRGAFFWKMQAGMGDIVFAPIYEVLKRRGVKFEFFHRLANVRLGAPATATAPGHIAGLDFLVQADIRGGREYEPLVSVHGLPSWPTAPDWDQLVDGETLLQEARQFESHWDERLVRTKSLSVGDDFDFVLLAVGGGAIPFVCADLLERDLRWRDMSRNLGTVATQALQIWTRTPMTDLGWHRGPVTMTAFVSPFDTWSDMTHLVPAEQWPREAGVEAIAYFCNVLDEREVARCGPKDEGHQARVQEVVRDHSRAFVSIDLPRLWPGLRDGGRVRWEALVDWRLHVPQPAAPVSLDPVDGLYFVANVNPTDRYVQCLPGTMRYRISPLDRSYDNLTIAGDWTDCGLSLGCVESAVMSGLLASHALSTFPPLASIVGYDHP